MPTFIGLDLETSGVEHGVHRTIQVGVCTGMEDTYTDLLDWGPGIPWDDEAEKVHGIPRDALEQAGQLPGDVDYALHKWLSLRGKQKDMIAVGWNVGSFDLPFIFRDLPLTHSYLSRRSVDLNSLCFSLEQSTRILGAKTPGYSWETWKKRSKQYAQKVLSGNGESSWHDALYDAKASLLAFYWLSERMAEGTM